ncbi:MAG: hypothetical protein ACJAVK_003384 [Akkermansiaceae bacterium]|jgi:hypothetical protein
MSVCVIIRCVEEALTLKAFGLRVAGALQEPLELWVADSEKVEGAWLRELEGLSVAEVRDLSGVSRKRKVLDAAKKEWP